MALEVILDEITRSTFEADTHGIRYLQAGVAKGINETDAGKLLARIPSLPGVPTLGTPHKIYSQALVTGYRVVGQADVDAAFYVVYESPSGYGLNFFTGQWYPFRNNTVGEIETWVDYTNTPIIVRYKAQGANAQTPRLGSGRKRVAYSDLTLIGVFNEDVSPAQEAAVGCTNIGPGNWYNKKPGTWLCTGLVSRAEIFGLTWRITATFSNNPATWDVFDRFIDPNTGQPPLDIDPQDARDVYAVDMTDPQYYRNGITRARVQKPIDFTPLFGNQ